MCAGRDQHSKGLGLGLGLGLPGLDNISGRQLLKLAGMITSHYDTRGESDAVKNEVD